MANVQGLSGSVHDAIFVGHIVFAAVLELRITSRDVKVTKVVYISLQSLLISPRSSPTRCPTPRLLHPNMTRTPWSSVVLPFCALRGK